MLTFSNCKFAAGSLWLTLAHSLDYFLTLWLTLTQSGSLWLSLWLSQALIGSQGPCSALQVEHEWPHFIPAWMVEIIMMVVIIMAMQLMVIIGMIATRGSHAWKGSWCLWFLPKPWPIGLHSGHSAIDQIVIIVRVMMMRRVAIMAWNYSKILAWQRY